MNTTVRIRASQLYKDWHVIDAAGRPLGRVATEAATLLRGKHKPTFEKHLDGGDFVIIVNASKVTVSGRKESQIKYYSHSGYPGGLKTRTYAEQMARFPDRVIEQAVWGMLPDGPLGKKMLRHLKVYAGPNHPHASQMAHTATSQAQRVASEAELADTVRTAPRLRPLSVPQLIEARTDGTHSRYRKGAPAPAPIESSPAKRARAPKSATATTVAAETEASTDTVLTSEAPVAEAAAINDDIVMTENPTPAEAAITQGAGLEVEKPKRVRKPLSESTSGEAGETPKPRARKPLSDSTSGVAGDTPKPRPRKPKTTAEAPAGEAKKPARRRTTPKTEE